MLSHAVPECLQVNLPISLCQNTLQTTSISDSDDSCAPDSAPAFTCPQTTLGPYQGTEFLDSNTGGHQHGITGSHGASPCACLGLVCLHVPALNFLYPICLCLPRSLWPSLARSHACAFSSLVCLHLLAWRMHNCMAGRAFSSLLCACRAEPWNWQDWLCQQHLQQHQVRSSLLPSWAWLLVWSACVPAF